MMPGMPKKTAMPVPKSAMPEPTENKRTDEGFIYYEATHDTRALNKGAKAPAISVWQAVAPVRGSFLARLLYGNVATNVIRPTAEMAHEGALQFYMNETRQGREDSTVVKKYEPTKK